jgi:hypothetical protein
MKCDKEHVRSLIDHVKNNMTDPFDVEACPKDLINIATGLHAKKEVEDSLLNCVDQGQKYLQSFVVGCLKENENRYFYSPISRSSLKTFEDMTKQSNLKCRTGDVVKAHIHPELVFRRALALANVREEVSVEKVLAYPVGPIPTAIFHDDGSMRKCCKSDLIHLLEKEISTSFILPSYDKNKSTLIRDGMGIIQSLNAKRYNTFGELAKDYFDNMVACFQHYGCVVDVFDRYDKKDSTKSAERERRSSSNPGKVFQIIERRSIPEWRKFLCTSENKQGLVKFLGEYALKHFHEFMKDRSEIFLAGCFENQEAVMKFSKDNVSDCEEIFSTQEVLELSSSLCLSINKWLKETVMGGS